MSGAIRRGAAVVARTGLYVVRQARHGHPRHDPTGPERFQALLRRLGGVYVKLGQLLSLQPDVLPRAYCNALFDLLDRMPAAEPSEIARALEEELGSSPRACFDTFQDQPIASASVAQVHVATRDGRKLAVKVQRPGAAADFAADLRLLSAIARWIRRLRVRSLFWLERVIGELELWTREELDFRYEARYQRALATLTRSSPIQVVPELVPGLCTERLLVAEFLDGPTLLDLIRGLEEEGPAISEQELDRLGFDADVLAGRVVESFVGNAFENGLFHADLHPANLLILPGNVLGFVDFGITGALSRYARREIVGVILAITEGDAVRLVDHLFRLSTFDPDARPERFRSEMKLAMDSWFDPDREPRQLSVPFTEIMLDVLRVSRRNGILATPDTVRYLRSVIGAEGLIRRFAPSYDVAGGLSRVCEEHLAIQQIRDRLDPGQVGGMISTLARQLPGLPRNLSRRLAAPRAGLRDGRAAERRRGPHRLLGLALIALALSLIVAWSESPAPGFNLFTMASAGVVVCWLLSLARTSWL